MCIRDRSYNSGLRKKVCHRMLYDATAAGCHQLIMHQMNAFSWIFELMFPFLEKVGENLLAWPVPVVPCSSPDVSGETVTNYWYSKSANYPFNKNINVLHSFASESHFLSFHVTVLGESSPGLTFRSPLD